MFLLSFFPGQAVLVSLFLKKIRNFLPLSSFSPGWTGLVPPFLKKICHIGYISRIFENVLAFQNFFQKIFLWHPPADRTSAFQQYSMRQLAKFAKSPLYRGYFKNHHQLCPSFLTFSKNFISSLLLSQKHPEMVTPFLNFFQKKRYTLPGLFPKQHPVVLLLSEKIPKNIITTPLIISFLSPKRYTVFKKIEKFLFPYLPYHRLGVVFVPFSPKKQAAKKRVALPLYRGYFQNLPQLRCCFPKKSEKNITSTPLTIKIPPPVLLHPFSTFFQKFLSLHC